MRTITLFLCTALAVTSIDAASYQKTDGTIVDPIRDVHGNVILYSGNNLESGANLYFANLSSANLSSATLYYANLSFADLSSATLSSATLTGANLTGANLTGAFLDAANLSDATLYYAALNDANLIGATLTDADLSSATLTGATLANADLNGANLTGSTISESQFLSAASVTGVNLTGHTMGGWDLTGADLTSADLTSATLTSATLTGATLTGATLTGANLHQALLPSAMPSLPVINGAVVKVVDTLAVSGSVQVDTGGSLSVTSDTFTAAGVNTQGGTVVAALHGLDLEEIGDVSGYGRLFGDVDLGASGAIAGSGAGLELFGHVSGSGTISGTTLFGNLDIGSSPGAITLEDVTLSAAGTTTFEVGGTTLADYDRILLAGGVMLDGVANVSFMGGFMPAESDVFQLIDLGSATVTGWFSSVNTPAGWSLSASGSLYNNSTAVPEPATLLLALFGLSLLPRRRRR